MAKKQYVQDDKPAMSAQARAWLDEEIKAQEVRFAAIVAEQEALTPEREKWYADFLHIIQTKGFNVTGDQRRRHQSAKPPSTRMVCPVENALSSDAR